MEKNPDYYDTLDGMRGIAALVVMIYHFFLFFLTPLQVITYVPRNAQLAVDFFFVLSGFVITHSYGTRLVAGTLTAKMYLLKRYIRLYPMFLTGLILGLVVLTFAKPRLYQNSDTYLLPSFIWNAFFLPYLSLSGSHPGLEIFPSNPPAWSLFFEMFASIAFIGLNRFKLGTLCKTLGSLVALIIFGIFLMYINGQTSFDFNQGWSSSNFLGGFPRVLFGFILGMIIYLIAADKKRCPKFDIMIPKYAKKSYLLYTLLAAVLLFPKDFKGLYPFLVLAIATPCLVYIGAKTLITGQMEMRIAKFLGWLSYPIYCLHYVIGGGLMLIVRNYQVIVSPWLLLTLAILLTVSASIAIALFAEEPMRKFLSRRLTNKAA